MKKNTRNQIVTMVMMSICTTARTVLTLVIVCLSGSVLHASTEQNQGISPQPSMRYTSRSEEAAGAWQANVRARLLQRLKLDRLISTRGSLPFDPTEILRTDQETYHVKEMEISATPTRRIRIIVTLPNSPAGPVPAVVCVGGHGSDLYSPYDLKTIAGKEPRKERDAIYKGFGSVLATMGYATVSTTVSQHSVHEAGWSLMGERLWDLMRCVDYMESLSTVDSHRIGCAGLSLGGEMTMWLGAMDERIMATVSAGFLTTMDHMEQNHCMCWKFDGLRELVDFADIYALIAPQPLQCQNGLLEPASQFYVPLARQAMENVRVIYRDMDRPENAILDVHRGGHIIDLPGLVYFFDKHLFQK